MLKKASKLYSKDNLGAAILIIFGTIIWSLTMVKSGLFYSFGMGFWGPNGHDGVWHIALTESLSRGSRGMPVFSGEILKNYHVGFDSLLAFLHKLTTIPISTLYFQIIPPILALLIGYLVYKFTLSWTKSNRKAWWATFFVYFGGNFGWIITLLREGKLGGESMFWAQQAISTLINPPFALSIVLILLGLLFLAKYLKTQTTKYFLVTTLVFGILLQIKVYAGILSLSGLCLAGVYNYLKERNFTILRVFIGSFLLSLILFLPFNKNSTSLLVFQPFWFLETMMGFADRLYWPKFFNAMIVYKQTANLIKGIPAYLVAFALFWFGNLGTRVIKEILVWKWLKNIKKLTFIEVFIISVIGVGILIPMLYIQKGTPWNTIQFIYYSLTFSGILAGITLGEFIEKSKLNRILSYIIQVAIFLLTIPTILGTLSHYLPSRPPAKITYQELGALEFLANQPQGVILTYPFDKEAAQAAVDNPPRPLYLYESTAYVSAFSGKPVFLEDEVNLDITGYDWRARRLKALEYFKSSDTSKARNFLKENNITYIYLIKELDNLEVNELPLTKIFENKEAVIYQID